MTFNSKFHQIKPGHKVFGGCVSYVEQYVERRGPRKGEFVFHISLKNDSDIELSSPNQHSQMAYFRNSGLVEVLPDLLVNPEAVAQIVTGDDRLRLILAGGEGQIDITRGKSRSRNNLGIYTVRDTDFGATRSAIEGMQGDEPANISNIQQTLEDMVGTFANIQTALDATNTGLASGTLLVDRIEVG